MGDFAWKSLVKQVEPVGKIVTPSVVAFIAGEGGQPAVVVAPIIGIAKVTLGVPSSVLANRKQDNDTGMPGRKKSRFPLSLRALWQAAGLTPASSRPSSL